MHLIPGPCSELILPDDCVDHAFQVGNCLVQACLEAIQPFLPDETGSCDPIAAFVSFASRGQPDDLCNQVTAVVDRIAPFGRKGCFSHWHISYTIEAVFSVFPGITQDPTGKVYLPTPDNQESAARWLLGVGSALTGAIWTALNGEDCVYLTQCDNKGMTDMLPVGPRGNCAGWKTTVTVDHRAG